MRPTGREWPTASEDRPPENGWQSSKVDNTQRLVDHASVSMNIKNVEAHVLAKELAALERTTVTDAVTLSLREALARRRAEKSAAARLEKMREIADRFAELEREDPGTRSLWKVNEDLYDELGLPR